MINNELELFDAEEGEEQQQPPAAAKLPKDFAVAVDAANTPQRLAQVLDDLREAGAKRIFTVFGADGQVGVRGPAGCVFYAPSIATCAWWSLCSRGKPVRSLTPFSKHPMFRCLCGVCVKGTLAPMPAGVPSTCC